MPRRLIIVLCVLALAAISNTSSFGLVFVPAAEGLGLEVAALGGLRTIENASSILAALMVAPLVDRFPRKWLLLSGYGLATLSVTVLVLLNNVAGVVLFFALNGAAIMNVFGAITAMPGDFVTGRSLNRIMGLIIGCVAFTSVLVAPVVGNVSDTFGWRAGMLVSAGVTGAAFVLSLLLVPGYRPPAPHDHGERFLSRYRQILARRHLLMVLGSNLLRFAQLSAMLTFLSTIMIQRYGLSLTSIGLIFSGVGLTFFASSFGSGIVLHWLRTWRVLVWGGCMIVALLSAMLIATLHLWLMIPAVFLFIGVVAAQENAGTIAALRLAGHARGAAMSWNELAAGAGALLGVGSGSIGLALGGISGLGVALTCVTALATVVSVVALRRANYSDDDGSGEVEWTAISSTSCGPSDPSRDPSCTSV